MFLKSYSVVKIFFTDSNLVLAEQKPRKPLSKTEASVESLMLPVIILLVSALTAVFSLTTLPLRGSLSQKGKTADFQS